MHMCFVPVGPLSPYDPEVDKEEASAAKREAIGIISRWRDRIMQAKGWKAPQWAAKAKISETTITRNMKPDSSNSAKIETLHMLARAARVPSVLDFLEGSADGPIGPDLPPADVLAVIFDELAAETVGARVPESALRPTGRALELLLQQISADPAIHANLDAVRAVVRTTKALLPLSTPEA